MPLLIIARLTLREAARRRLLYAVAILTIIIIGFTGWGFSRITTLRNGQPLSHDEVMLISAQLVILVAYMFSFVLAIGAAFLGAPTIAGDVESGLVLALLPRPLRRLDLVLGKWLGLAILLAGYAVLSSGGELLVVKLVTGYVPPHPAPAIAYITAEGLVVLTVALLFSTRLAPITGGIIAVVLFGVAWIAGIAQAVGAAFNNTAITNAGAVVSLLLPSDGLWRGAIFNLQPGVLTAVAGSTPAARANAFSVVAAPSVPYLIWAVAWVVVILGLAALRFSRRDL